MDPVGYRSKRELLTELVRGGSVLHLGAVGDTCSDTAHRVAAARSSVHAYLTEAAGTCVGVDYDAPAVEQLTAEGVFDNLVCADVTTLERDDVSLGRIDYIVAGDTIEHLSRPGDLLDAAARLADDTTTLVITTPNALSLPLFLRHTMRREIEGDDHVCSFNTTTLTNLLRRHGWRVQRMWSCYQEQAAGSRLFALGSRVLRLVPRWGGTLLVVARREEPPRP